MKRVRFMIIVLLIGLASTLAARTQTVEWVQRFGERGNYRLVRGTSVDGLGRIYLIGDQRDGSHLRVFDRAGMPLTDRRIVSSRGPIAIHRAVTDASGRIVMVGAVCESLVVGDPCKELAYIRVTSASGGLIWEDSFGSPRNFRSNLVDVATNAAGDIVVVGVAPEMLGVTGYNVVRLYRPDGAIAWTRLLPEPQVNAVAIRASGHVYIGGGTNIVQSCTEDDICGATSMDGSLRKLDPTGADVWFKTIHGSPYAEILRLAPYPSGGVVAIGQEGRASPGVGAPTAFATAFDADGVALWHQAPVGQGEVTELAVDPAGASYIVGNTDPLVDANRDAYIAKLSPSGVMVWLAQFQRMGSLGLGIALDPSGFYLSGLIASSFRSGPPGFLAHFTESSCSDVSGTHPADEGGVLSRPIHEKVEPHLVTPLDKKVHQLNCRIITKAGL